MFPDFRVLEEDRAIALLKTPLQALESPSDRYLAASQLAYYPSLQSITALMDTLMDCTPVLEQRITRRKALESLGRLRAKAALPLICQCLEETDPYLVENAVWAIGEIGAGESATGKSAAGESTAGKSAAGESAVVKAETLQKITNLLERPGQNYRVILQTLIKLETLPGFDRLQLLSTADNPLVASTALAAAYYFQQQVNKDSFPSSTTDLSQPWLDHPHTRLLAFLHHPQANVRRGVIQDLMLTRCYAAIPALAVCPVSLTFRLRGLGELVHQGLSKGCLTWAAVEPHLDRAIWDHPHSLSLIPSLPLPSGFSCNPSALIQTLYHTDAHFCYQATLALLVCDRPQVRSLILETCQQEAQGDYGAHYHLIKLIGWLGATEGYDCLVQALQNPAPQFHKSRIAAAIALAALGDRRALDPLQAGLAQASDLNWSFKYASILALEHLGTAPSHTTPSHITPSHTTPSHITPSHITPSHTTPSRITPSRITSSLTIPSLRKEDCLRESNTVPPIQQSFLPQNPEPGE